MHQDFRPADLTPAQLLDRSIEYRFMAALATTTSLRDSLLRLAVRFEWRAVGKQMQAQYGSPPR
jgi:hypothetical protein